MEDNSAKMRANMERVLRAMDVIPPLGSGRAKRDRPDAGGKFQEDTAPPVDRSISLESPAESDAIPQFDLGEKILAEQRRLTATRRKAPGAVEMRFDDPTEPAEATQGVPQEGHSLRERLAELQRIVADIVARDIERLCTGPIAKEKGLRS